MLSPKKLAYVPTSPLVMLPLRLFLGITFVYAGLQKFTDPQFFEPGTPGYIGKQVIAFAAGSPLHTFLLTFVAPQAMLFGFAIAYGEIAIGLGTLFGVLLRPAAFFGMLISILLFLTATWHVYPYFYGSDIVFVFCWLTLMLNGPINTGFPVFDELLALSLVSYTDPARRPARANTLALLLGVPPELSLPEAPLRQPHERKSLARASQARRNFLFGLIGGGAAMFALLGTFYTISRKTEPIVHEDTTSTPGSAPTTSPAPGTPATTGTTTPTTTQPGTQTVIARVSAVPRNSAVLFTLPTSGDPGVLIHTQDEKFVAFDATCTHAGCQVDYDPASQLLACPCHGAEFDPTQQASPVRGPAMDPLAPVAITIDSTTGAITLKLF